MKMFKYLLLIISIAYLASCSTGSVREKKYIIKDGHIIASIFKENEKEYYVWTKEEVKATQEAVNIRGELNLYVDKRIYFFSDSTLNEGNYYASYSEILSKNPEKSFNSALGDRIYMEGNDTIAFLSYEDGGICNIYTNNRIYNKDVPLLNRALKALGVERNNTVFLFLNKNNFDENYYASYNGSAIHQKERKEQALSRLITELKSLISISDKRDIIAFFAKTERAEKEILLSNDIEIKNKIRNVLSSFQKKHFPMARKAYYNNAKNELWEKNIEVSMSGRDITFTGHMFIDNKVKKDTYLEIKDELIKLRFKSVGFRAFDGDDKTYWELDSKKDNEI